MLGSMTSGFFARLPCHPLDTCKAKLQIQQTTLINNQHRALKQDRISISSIDPHQHSKFLQSIRNIPIIGQIIAGQTDFHQFSNSKPFKNTVNVLSRTIKREGIAGLYRGIVITAFGSIPAGGLYFTSYEYTRRYLNRYELLAANNYISDFIGGFVAEIIACMLYVPIDVVKERLQVQSIIDPKFRYRSTLDAFRSLIKYEGLRGIYKAYGATILSFGPFSAINLMLYEQIKYVFVDYNPTVEHISQLSTYEIASSAGIASGIAAVITNPLDMIKLRLQVQRGGIFDFGYRHLFHGLYSLVQREGYQALMHGWGARVAFCVPNAIVILTFYETFTRFYKRNIVL